MYAGFFSGLKTKFNIFDHIATQKIVYQTIFQNKMFYCPPTSSLTRLIFRGQNSCLPGHIVVPAVLTNWDVSMTSSVLSLVSRNFASHEIWKFIENQPTLTPRIHSNDKSICKVSKIFKCFKKCLCSTEFYNFVKFLKFIKKKNYYLKIPFLSCLLLLLLLLLFCISWLFKNVLPILSQGMSEYLCKPQDHPQAQILAYLIWDLRGVRDTVIKSH